MEAKARTGKDVSTRRTKHPAGTVGVIMLYPLVDHQTFLLPTRGTPTDNRITLINNAIVNRLYMSFSILATQVVFTQCLILQNASCYHLSKYHLRLIRQCI